MMSPGHRAGFFMPFPHKLRRIPQNPLVNHVTYSTTLNLQPLKNRVTVNYNAVDYQLNNRPTNHASYESRPIFQQSSVTYPYLSP